MGIDADPAVLARGVDRLSALAGELAVAAHRLGAATGDDRRPAFGDWTRRCAALAAGLRSARAELLACAELLRQDRAGLLAGEEHAVAALAPAERRLSERAEWVR